MRMTDGVVTARRIGVYVLKEFNCTFGPLKKEGGLFAGVPQISGKLPCPSLHPSVVRSIYRREVFFPQSKHNIILGHLIIIVDSES